MGRGTYGSICDGLHVCFSGNTADWIRLAVSEGCARLGVNCQNWPSEEGPLPSNGPFAWSDYCAAGPAAGSGSIVSDLVSLKLSRVSGWSVTFSPPVAPEAANPPPAPTPAPMAAPLPPPAKPPINAPAAAVPPVIIPVRLPLPLTVWAQVLEDMG